MQRNGAAIAAAWVVIGLALRAQSLPFEPVHNSGQSITGAYEGWYANPDGTYTLLVGYYNRNLKVEIDIPVGPSNRIEPSGPDRGQPTHFLPGRHWGVFTIVVPKDFGDSKFTWTLIVNGKTTVIPMSLNGLWEVSPYREAGGNTPPYIGFTAAGPFAQGPRGQATTLTATVATPLSLNVWVADDAKAALTSRRPQTPPATVTWSRHRGPASMTFANEKPPLEFAEFNAPPSTTFRGKAETTATFSEPGEYILRIVANDWSGDGGNGFQCCWTNAYIKVSVTAAPNR